MQWHFRGSPHFVAVQGRRLGLSIGLLARSKPNEELRSIGSLVAQLCDRYHRAGKTPDGTPIFGHDELKQVAAALGQAEIQVDKLHAVAAASQAILGEVYDAYRLPPPTREFRVVCDYDEITAGLPAADGTAETNGHDEHTLRQIGTMCELCP